MKNWLIYGANGVIGQRIAREAVRRGYQPILAGRNDAAIMQLADELDLTYRVFDLQHGKIVRDQLADISVLINCAGPFALTASALRLACLKCGCHYLDLSCSAGDIIDSLNCQSEAREQGVVMMPALGFDSVIVDYLIDSLSHHWIKAESAVVQALQIVVRTGYQDQGVMRSALVEQLIACLCDKKPVLQHYQTDEKNKWLLQLHPKYVAEIVLATQQDNAVKAADISVYSSIHPYQKRWLNRLRVLSLLLPASMLPAVANPIRQRLRQWYAELPALQSVQVQVEAYIPNVEAPVVATCEVSDPETFTVTSMLSALEYVMADKVMPGAAMPINALDLTRVAALVCETQQQQSEFLEIDSEAMASLYHDDEIV